MPKPGRKKKKFIDKKNAVTFSLVHRSQRDPLQADEDAPQHVLLPTDVSEKDRVAFRKEEQEKYGIFYSDDYDYLQHLRDVDELYDVAPGTSYTVPAQDKSKKQIQLPSSVFGSTAETSVGLLNKAAPESGPRLDWDPDIVAALDDDFNFDDPENQLADDFVIRANDEGSDLGSDQENDLDLESRGGQATLDFVKSQRVHFGGDGPLYQGESDEADVASDEADLSDGGSDIGSYDKDFMQEETKSRFTSYSMTSSVIRRNEGLTMLDDKFEKLYEEYDEEEIGGLEHEEITGCITSDSAVLNSLLDEFEKTHTVPKMKDVVQPGEGDVMSEEESESEDEFVDVVVDEKPQEKWDCESILSTYSNLYNHPKTIEVPKKVKPIKLTKRTAIPADTLPERGLTRRQLEESLNPGDDLERAPTYRPNNETAEEKKSRKQAVKEERRGRREQKKATKSAFKDEKRKQEKEIMNLKNNMQGIKIV